MIDDKVNIQEEAYPFLKLVNERLKMFSSLIKEGYTIKDKLIILIYHLKLPLQAFNYFIGRRNSRKLFTNVYIKNRYGLFFCGDNFSSVFGVSSSCEPIMREYLVLNEGVAIDMGSNCGMFTIPLAKMLGDRGRVISIEPDKKNIRLLKKNIILNGLKNVTVVERGCFSKEGRMTFYLDELGTGGHSLLKGRGAKETIHVDTIDNILKNLKIYHVDLIKMDVMGVELEAFKGAKQTLKKSHPKIVFELLNKEDKERVYSFLSKYGYKIKQITDWNHFAV